MHTYLVKSVCNVKDTFSDVPEIVERVGVGNLNWVFQRKHASFDRTCKRIEIPRAV